MRTLLLPIGLIVLTGFAEANNGINCESQLVRTDRCIRRALLIGDHNVEVPKSVKEMDKHCSVGKQNLNCIRNYGKCLKLFPRQIFGMVLGNMRRILRDTCDTEKGRLEFLKHSKCMKPEYMPQFHSMVDRFNIQLLHIAFNVSKDMKIPYLCCTYFMNYEIIKDTVNKACKDITGPDTLEYVVDLFRKVMAEAVDLGCGKYNSVNQCQRMMPEGVEELRSLVTPEDKIKPQNFTFLIPLIEITRALDEA